MLNNIRIFAKLHFQPLWLDTNQYRNTVIIVKCLTHIRRKEWHFAYGTQANTPEFYRSSRLQTAYRIFKEHQIINVIGVQRILNALLIIIQNESCFRCHWLP
ncbi:Uncharacterised protein [Shigella sonnei]|nr:Uncharacterised protein [Shigella sonnei]